MTKKKKSQREKERRRQERLLRKRRRDAERQKAKTHAVSESALQHQLVATFGSPENLFKNLVHLGEMFTTEEELKSVRFDADAIYEKLNLEEMRDKLEAMYEAENPLLYPEDDQDFWREVRKEILPDLVSEDLAKQIAKKFEILIRKKKGIRKDYLAASAGKLLAHLHIRALTHTEMEDNALWELIFNLTLQENQRELPEPAEAAPEAEGEGQESREEARPRSEEEAPSEISTQPEATADEGTDNQKG